MLHEMLPSLENPVEHGGTRMQYVHAIDQYYRVDYEAVFGPLPDLSDSARFPASAGPVNDPNSKAAWEAMSPEDRDAVNRVYANIGKALADGVHLPQPAHHRQPVAVGVTAAEGKKRVVAVAVRREGEAVLEAVCTCFVLPRHVLDAPA